MVDLPTLPNSTIEETAEAATPGEPAPHYPTQAGVLKVEAAQRVWCDLANQILFLISS